VKFLYLVGFPLKLDRLAMSPLSLLLMVTVVVWAGGCWVDIDGSGSGGGGRGGC
jgi:hypothetical protein